MSLNLNFTQLCDLFKSDPEAFESFRKREIDKFIEGCSEKSQHRLRGLQFQIDAKRTINKDKPYVSCMEISKMMHNKFNELNFELNSFCKPNQYPKTNASEQAQVYSEESRVVAFRR
jgi:hypothetical protein